MSDSKTHKARRILRQRALEDYTGMGRTKIYEEIDAGRFPKPFKIVEGGRVNGWWEDEVAAWQQRSIVERVTAKKGGR